MVKWSPCQECKVPKAGVRAYKVGKRVLLLCPEHAKARGLPVLRLNPYADG